MGAAEWEGRPGLPDRSGLTGIVLSVGRFLQFFGTLYALAMCDKSISHEVKKPLNRISGSRKSGIRLHMANFERAPQDLSIDKKYPYVISVCN